MQKKSEKSSRYDDRRHVEGEGAGARVTERQGGLCEHVDVALLALRPEQEAQAQRASLSGVDDDDVPQRVGELEQRLRTHVVLRRHLRRRVHVELPVAAAQRVRQMRSPHPRLQLKRRRRRRQHHSRCCCRCRCCCCACAGAVWIVAAQLLDLVGRRIAAVHARGRRQRFGARQQFSRTHPDRFVFQKIEKGGCDREEELRSEISDQRSDQRQRSDSEQNRNSDRSSVAFTTKNKSNFEFAAFVCCVLLLRVADSQAHRRVCFDLTGCESQCCGC
jgi:hypothetical protein